MSETAHEHSPTQRHEPGKAGGPDSMLSGNKKFYLIGALAAIAVLVFVFVRKSNSNASAATSTTAMLDPTTEAALQSALQGQASAAYAAYTVPPSSNTGTTSTSGTATSSVPSSSSGSPLTIQLPNAGGQSWESVVFPNQNAYSQWQTWNQGFVNNNNAQATRGQWNAELTSLGVTGVNGTALTGPNPNSPNPYDQQ